MRFTTALSTFVPVVLAAAASTGLTPLDVFVPRITSPTDCTLGDLGAPQNIMDNGEHVREIPGADVGQKVGDDLLCSLERSWGAPSWGS
ncbi:hypothetical protein B0H19DRAFT_1271900 [Mycena capillaripes]|nr:hypothetical protein B0H19DRAFT_1271900 [Mycena capillaripes]